MEMATIIQLSLKEYDNKTRVPIKFYGNLREPEIKSAYFINAGNVS